MSIANSIHHSKHIYNYFKTLNLGLFLSDVYLNHLMTIILSVFLRGYRGKTVDFQEVSHCHRTITAYFLNHGKTSGKQVLKVVSKRLLIKGSPTTTYLKLKLLSYYCYSFIYIFLFFFIWFTDNTSKWHLSYQFITFRDIKNFLYLCIYYRIVMLQRRTNI